MALRQRFVPPATCRLNGAKNGKMIGKASNIVQRSAERAKSFKSLRAYSSLLSSPLEQIKLLK
jgi:hypothetical protein